MKNEYDVIGDTVYVKVKSRKYGEFIINIDVEDMHRLDGFTIGVKMKGPACKPYAYAYKDKKQIDLHRFILNYYDKLHIDHRNGNGLDNTRGNLRIGTRSLNLQNVKMFAHNTTGIKGLSWDKKREKWVVFVKLNGKLIWQRRFPADMKDEAVEALNQARAKYHPWAPVYEES